MPDLKFKAKVIEGESFEDIQVGSDPELRFEGLQARRVVPEHGLFGADGPNSHVGELRPKPTFCPINHVANTEKIMRDGFRKFKQLQNRKWFGGSYPEEHPIGGHIHIGSPGTKDLALKLEAMDKLLAIPALMIERAETARKRRGHQYHGVPYGRLATHGAYEGPLSSSHRGFKTKRQASGSEHPMSHDGYEYRPLASWLVSKQIANAILAMAKVIAFQTHNKKLHKGLGLKLKFLNNNSTFQRAYYDCDKRFFVDKISTIERIIRSFKLYPFYAKYINYLFQLIAQGRTWDEDIDLKTRWNIVPTIKRSNRPSRGKKNLNLESIWDTGDIGSLSSQVSAVEYLQYIR